MPTKITLTRGTKTYDHMIDISGTAGVIFWVVLASLLGYVIAFSTPGWQISGRRNEGLWETCTCSKMGNESWIQATQAMATIGLIFLVFALIAVSLYMFVHNFSKNNVLIATTLCCFLACIFILIAVIIYGVKRERNLHYSFAFACMACITSLIAGIVSVVQMSRARVCQ